MFRIILILSFLVCSTSFSRDLSGQNKKAIGVLWTSWDPYHFQNYEAYIQKLQSWGIDDVSLNPTYFIDTYEEGIITHVEGVKKTPSFQLQKDVIKALITEGFTINFRPHIDPVKYAYPEGARRRQIDSDPGGKDWRGKFHRLDPLDPKIQYFERVILQGLAILDQAVREAGAPATPIRFDLGAELMDSVLFFPDSWLAMVGRVRALLEQQYSSLAPHVTLGYNFCHHINILLRVPHHDEYIRRSHPYGSLDPEGLYLDRPGVGSETKATIAEFIQSLDAISLSQYMPLDRMVGGGAPTPESIAQALKQHENVFINEVLRTELGIPQSRIPAIYLGEFGIGWRGLAAPNVWDRQAWIDLGQGHLILDDQAQKDHAALAIDGLIEYMRLGDSAMGSALLWMGGKPYDVLNLNDYSDWYNDGAAASLRSYWTEGEN